MTAALLEARAVSKIFPLAGDWLSQKQSLQAVTDVSLKLPARGDSGAGGRIGLR